MIWKLVFTFSLRLVFVVFDKQSFSLFEQIVYVLNWWMFHRIGVFALDKEVFERFLFVVLKYLSFLFLQERYLLIWKTSICIYWGISICFILIDYGWAPVSCAEIWAGQMEIGLNKWVSDTLPHIKIQLPSTERAHSKGRL